MKPSDISLPDDHPSSTDVFDNNDDDDNSSAPSWRLNLTEFRLPPRIHHHSCFPCHHLLPTIPRQECKMAEYYKKRESLLEGYNEMEAMTESGCLPGSLTEHEMKQLAKSERFAVHISNVANMVLFIAKVYASVESRSLAVIASTLDSFLDLLSGFILWFTANAMRKPNNYRYPIGKNRMQPVVCIIVFASVMATLGFQILLESARDLNSKDHFFDVIANFVGLVTAVIANRYYWWMNQIGVIMIAIYTISTWARTVIENVRALIGKTAPPEFIAKLTFLIWNHHEEIKQIDRAYTFVLPEDMLLNQAHNIEETLQEKLEQLPEVERAFVHIDFEVTHKPEHKNKV
ncbi:hypothetical protein BT93_L3292 [Corymbia citriodora subsp. variegata]|uniref:Cation efflux protein transmembrane domain-containing protein n=1 Tax=Corymbia citriodora subsp. variegata TaxID=360336 RepID=A0A8T0CZU0_CORYI|nr:hypothetical protein BT93_L3292 [Corymbia citriodora subsp. variegata]